MAITAFPVLCRILNSLRILNTAVDIIVLSSVPDLAIKLTGKIENHILTLVIPMFFALSGYNTNLGLLDSSKI
ncbi:hypothetical protein M501DRAFT_1014523 [Patellaria atrata CBS 101060]|uniref:Uncharacterized protein n=1 Tax=Patellaria atrata CBS 101060 TaxID=1346257 RepID=A0A9P4SG76_9PEZI|nr:hypothetical protein M501DRAFT_1014523 [Patellaria atrata CBS 101060]